MQYSQYGQDRHVMQHYLSHLKMGFFVELGALDGLRHSNIKLFEDLGWAGICIEPHPTLFKALAKNRRCACLEVLVTSQPLGTAEFLAIDPAGPVGLSGRVACYDARHLERVKRECSTANAAASNVAVRCTRLSSVLSAQNVQHVDFLSLDVEGAELDVLKSVDWDATSFSVLLIENNYSDTSVERFLEANGYRKAERLFCDDVYVPVRNPAQDERD